MDLFNTRRAGGILPLAPSMDAADVADVLKYLFHRRPPSSSSYVYATIPTHYAAKS